MAVNATRCGDIAQKKSKRLLAVLVNDELYEDLDLIVGAGTQDLLVANLPEHSVIVNAYVTVREGSDSATAATVAIGTTEGGAEILAATDVTTVAVAGTLVGQIDTGTGQEIYAQLVNTGATTTLGDFTVVIEYDEYEKNNGEYTRFTND